MRFPVVPCGFDGVWATGARLVARTSRDPNPLRPLPTPTCRTPDSAPSTSSPAAGFLRGSRPSIQQNRQLGAGEEILRTATLARLTYDGPDGTPRVIPIGFLWTGHPVVATHSTSPKFAALRARPRVALTIDTPSPARSLLLRGEAEIEVVDGHRIGDATVCRLPIVRCGEGRHPLRP